MSSRHDLKPLGKSMMARSHPIWNKDREMEIRHREGDQRFIRELAKAFQRGDHIPAGQPKPLRLIG